MKLQRTLIATGLLAATFTALAQMPGHGPGMGAGPREGGTMMAHRGMNPQERHAMMEERVNHRLNVLKLRLALTPAQEGAWNAFVAGMKPPAMQHPDRAEMAKLTTPERIDRMRAMRDQRNAAQDKRAEATKTFYAQLSADQKKVFDGETLRMGPGGGMRGHGGSGGMGGHGGHGGHGGMMGRG